MENNLTVKSSMKKIRPCAPQCAFIDESGGAGLDFTKNTFSHFILVAVILDSKNFDTLEDAIKKVAKTYFQGSEIKSSKIGNNFKRRLKVLDAFLPLDFHLYALVVHKKRLLKYPGYNHEETFFKALHNKLDRELLRTYPFIDIYFDKFKDQNFMKSLKKYLSKKFSGTFESFANQKTEPVDAEECGLIQAADFFAGTIAYAFEENKATAEGKALLGKIKKLTLKEFPYEPTSFIYEARSELDDKFSSAIADLACRRAMEFIKSNQNAADQDIMDQVRCLEFLLQCYKFDNPEEYISTPRLLEELNRIRPTKIANDEQFRRGVIGPLRDQGVLISSRSSRPAGYKIPYETQDIYDFINHGNSIIIPMLSRIRTCQEAISQKTSFKLDILDKPEYSELKKLVARINLEDLSLIENSSPLFSNSVGNLEGAKSEVVHPSPLSSPPSVTRRAES